MKRALITAALACALAMPASALASAAGPENGFALSLLGRLGGNANLVYSPYSIDVALTMAAAGAKGPTAAQMAKALDEPSVAEALSNAASLRKALAVAARSGSGAPVLDVANALWTQSGLALEPPFVATLTDDFGAPPQSTDFASQPAAALKAINTWVAQHTNSLIPSLLPPGSVTPQTAFVLANAIYLKAHWQTPFAKNATHSGAFTTAGGQSVQVPFMHQSAINYEYAAGPGYQAVSLPYSSSTLSALAILPRGRSLASFDQSLNASSLATLIGSLSPAEVNLALPKLNLSTQTSLNTPLEQLGMTDAFTPSADFSGVTAQRRLQISLVEHAAVLKLDEQGTVAAGATAVVAPTAAVPVRRPTVNMVLDRPFLLLLMDETSHTILFVARVENPAEG